MLWRTEKGVELGEGGLRPAPPSVVLLVHRQGLTSVTAALKLLTGYERLAEIGGHVHGSSPNTAWVPPSTTASGGGPPAPG